MPIISTFYGIIIQMYWVARHAPPHFHANYAEDEVVIDIRTLEILKGKMSRRRWRWYWNGHRNTAPNLYRGLGIMSTQTVTKKDIAASVVPPIKITAPWRVKAVEALDGYRLRVSLY